MRTPVPRVAAIHDLSGFGRTSLTVAMPVLSSMGVQVCPLPTAVLSTHTSGFENFSFVDLTEQMHSILDHWQSLNLKFDAVYSGFLGSPEQVDIVARCIDMFRTPDGLAVVDPVMGDNGEMEPTMTLEMVHRMRWLVTKADIITPNFTEAAFLLDEKYTTEATVSTVKDWLRRLTAMGPSIAIITSVPVHGDERRSAVMAYNRRHDRFWKVDCSYIPAHYPGTGDTFASVVTGALLQGDSLPIAMDRAVQFVTMGIRATFGHNLPSRDGILLERVLDTLRAPVTSSSFELLDNDGEQCACR
ncbi:Phosphomethylpyrimidine kinase type-1 [Oleidesulfovibrio alaskensis G20]|jgi:pyridoxine kinase|uniref:pyridoxal kinase n=1 Tax=Oleidesulfovibrio alaskensis (strain ATCC BAA-1058 / DSM 17464 / G20) TaxID=207559 RepID=Q30XQ8_OLEA2|nr:pyridoxamine kinase [Oleidesulfovibrio alaskensis]ABB39538.1 Phosphomethylpyrimidine kinase type-1 [Oleidesulfovibrio alaskensis G20]MBG0772397.1 pyridoxamine kinase [Oleidesulfovibrio alaskensis]MBL3582241.1 pyridoxamine kinase [Oleidesulfovibrio alaskensis]